MTTELHPCPFCGGDATIYYNDNSDYRNDWHHTVECDDCVARVFSYGGDDHKGRQDAIKEWNRRATPPQQDISPFLSAYYRAVTAYAKCPNDENGERYAEVQRLEKKLAASFGQYSELNMEREEENEAN